MRVRGAGRAAVVLLVAACGRGGDAPEEGARASAALPAEGVQVELDRPDSLAWGRESTLRLRVANRGADSLAGARLRVLLPAGLTAVDPPGTAAGGGTRAEFAVAALPPGQAAEFALRFRLPATAPADTSTAARSFVVHAAVVSAAGTPVGTPDADTLTVAGPARAALGCGAAGRLPVTRYGVGAVRLGLPRAQTEAMCPGTSDTAWTAGEGRRQRGVVVPVGGDTVFAILAGDTVVRFRILDPDLRTAAGMGVGSTLGDLRTRLGRTCAGLDQGRAAVWFPNAPGLSFALSAAPPPQWSRVERDPSLLPDTATVTELSVRRGTDDCPAVAPRPATGTPPPAPDPAATTTTTRGVK